MAATRHVDLIFIMMKRIKQSFLLGVDFTNNDTYVPEENSSGSNVYLNGTSTVAELPTPSRGTVKVKVTSNVHPESEINLRCLDKIF